MTSDCVARSIIPRSIGIVVYLRDCFSPHRFHFFARLFWFLFSFCYFDLLSTICISLYNVALIPFLSSAWVQLQWRNRALFFLLSATANAIASLLLLFKLERNVHRINGKHSIFFDPILPMEMNGAMLPQPCALTMVPLLHWQICGESCCVEL